MLKVGFAKLTFFALLLLTIHASSEARDTFSTIGKRTCLTWSEDFKKSQGKEVYDSLAFMLDRTWLLGFASGINILAQRDVLEEIDAGLLTDWTTKYCQENPDKDLLEAMTSLLVETRRISEVEKKVRRAKER
jgi:hypothetical protein